MKTVNQISLAGLVCAVILHGAFGGDEDLSDQLPPGKTLSDLGLGERPFGSTNLAVRLVEWASFPANYFCQQMGAHGDKLYFGIKRGLILEYALDGTPSAQPFLDVAALRGSAFRDNTNSSISYGLKGFAIHPGFGAGNQLVYTLHTESNTGSADHYITSGAAYEYVLGEWDLSGASTNMREVFRVGYPSPSIAHRAQHIGFSPEAEPGDADYGHLYACFGDGTSGNAIIDFYDNAQNFSNITASVIRINPADPSGQTDGELAAAGLKRSANGGYSIPLDNHWVGVPGYAEELFAKGLRNPVTMNFAPDGSPMVGDVGEQSMEEINLIQNGGNYGWSLREGTFVFTHVNQTNHTFQPDPDMSLTWVPYGDPNDPPYEILFRDADGTNPTTNMIARSGGYDDGLVYPVAQFTHEGNRTTDGRTAVAAGQYYDGFWSEELEGLYVFGDFTKGTLFYIQTKDIVNDDRPADVSRLPLIDQDGNPTTLEAIIGAERSNMRFGKDSYGNLYLVSKTNFKVYRFQGTPEVNLALSSVELPDGKEYPVIRMTHPGPDSTRSYGTESADDLSFTNASSAFVETGAVTNANSTVDRSFRHTVPFESADQQFYRSTVNPIP